MNSLSYEVQPQNLSGLEGELILAKVDGKKVGRTGYLPCNSHEYQYNGHKNALMKLSDSFSDIEVDGPMREKGIGLFLLDLLIERLIAKDYNTLIITQPDGQKQFYSSVLGKLQESGKITSWRYDCVFEFGPVYEVRI